MYLDLHNEIIKKKYVNISTFNEGKKVMKIIEKIKDNKNA